jgi:hypothetical protein
MNIIVKKGALKRLPINENNFLPSMLTTLGQPVEDSLLQIQQLELSNILETAGSYQQAQQWLHQSALANTAWEIENWEPHMLETAIAIAQKWKHGFS